MFVTLSTRLD